MRLSFHLWAPRLLFERKEYKKRMMRLIGCLCVLEMKAWGFLRLSFKPFLSSLFKVLKLKMDQVAQGWGFRFAGKLLLRMAGEFGQKIILIKEQVFALNCRARSRRF
jgi:hypothetical protein